MRLGLVADIHGNVDALTATLAEARALGVQRLLCCGDVVGYYYEPAQCLELLAEWETESVRGNHENMLSRLINEPAVELSFRRQFGSGLSVAATTLTPKQLTYLASLPAHKALEIEGKTILLCHGAPWDTDEYVYPESQASTFLRCASLGADYVVMGHTHCQMEERIGTTVLINPGSVGQPRRGRPAGHWAVLDLDSGVCTHHTADYDPGGVIARARETDPHFPFLWQVLDRQ